MSAREGSQSSWIFILFVMDLFLVGSSSQIVRCLDDCTCTMCYGLLNCQAEVNCQDKGFTKVPAIGDEYPEASSVNLSGNRIELITRNDFSDLHYLQTLDLRSNFLEHLSVASFNISQVMYSPLLFIDLSENHLHEVPSCFQYQNEYSTKLHNLTDLLISGNELGSVIQSHSFSATRYLERLDLSRNRIARIEERTLRYLPNLQAVNLEFNVLKSISPSVFGRKTPLLSLKLTSNKLSTIPDGLPTTLRILELGENKIENITLKDVNALHNLPNLETLNVSRNSLRAVAAGAFITMKKLRVLDLSNNNIFSLQSDIFVGAVELEYLFLNRNPFMTHLPENIFSDLAKLKFLFLHGCSLRTLSIGSPSISPHSFSFSSSVTSDTVDVDPYIAPQLKALWLFANPINCDCQILPLVWFLKRRNVTMDPNEETFISRLGKDPIVQSHIQNGGMNGGLLPTSPTICATPFNRHNKVVGEKMLEVPENFLICPDQPLYVIVSMFLGIILFAGAIPVVFLIVFLYLCIARFFWKSCGISSREEND